MLYEMLVIREALQFSTLYITVIPFVSVTKYKLLSSKEAYKTSRLLDSFP